jgi:predicted DNA-binding transcriptional regulator YafY
MRGSQLARQWKVLRLIESRRRGVTAFEIASRLDVGLRTVYRDLDAVQAAGFPIYNERVEKKLLLETD